MPLIAYSEIWDWSHIEMETGGIRIANTGYRLSATTATQTFCAPHFFEYPRRTDGETLLNRNEKAMTSLQFAPVASGEGDAVFWGITLASLSFPTMFDTYFSLQNSWESPVERR